MEKDAAAQHQKLMERFAGPPLIGYRKWIP
jgi:hypothetical protein